MKIKRLFTSLLLAVILVFTSVISSFAASNTDPLDDVTEKVKNELVKQNIDAEVTRLSSEDATAFFGYMKTKVSVKQLMNSLQEENYVLDEDNTLSMEISDNTSYASMMIGMEVYKDGDENTVVTTYFYDITNDSLEVLYAQKITPDKNVSDYFLKHDTTPSQLKSFNVQSFICGLGGTLACGAYSAMLMAIVPLSIAAGITCSAAFAYVCAYA